MYASSSSQQGPTLDDEPDPPPTSSPVDVARPLSRQKVSASLEKLLGAGLSPPGRGCGSGGSSRDRDSGGSRDRSSSREGLSSSGDDLSPARETTTMTTSGEFDRAGEKRSSLFEESWNPLEDDDQYDRPARPKSCDALSAGSLPLTSSDSRSRDELGSTEDELDSGIMDDDQEVQMRRRQRSLSDRSSSRSLEDQLDFACIESSPQLSSDGMKHRISLTKQSTKMARRRKPTRGGRHSEPPGSTTTTIPEVTPQRETMDPGLLVKHTTPPISPSILRKSQPSPRPRQTPPTTPGRSPIPSPRPTPPTVRAAKVDSKELSDHSPGHSATSPTVSVEPVSMNQSMSASMGASVSPPGAVLTPPGMSMAPAGPALTPPGLVPPIARPRSVTEPFGRSPGLLMAELKQKAASREDLRHVTPTKAPATPQQEEQPPVTPTKAMKPVLPDIGSPVKVQKIDGAVTTESHDSGDVTETPPLSSDSSPAPVKPGRLVSPRSRTPDPAKPALKAKPKPSPPPKSSSPTWFDKIRLRKKAASVDVPEKSDSPKKTDSPKSDSPRKTDSPKSDSARKTDSAKSNSSQKTESPKTDRVKKTDKVETSHEVTVQKPSAQKPVDTGGPGGQAGTGTPPWLRETRLRRSASRGGGDDVQKVESGEKPSWMREVLARRRKTQEKLNVGDLSEPDKQSSTKSSTKSNVTPLKASEDDNNKNVAATENSKTAKNNAKNNNHQSKPSFYRKDRDQDSGTSSCEQSPLRRPLLDRKRDENVPPVTSSSSVVTSSKSDVTSQTGGGVLGRGQSPLPPIKSGGGQEKEVVVETSSVPSWKAELAIRKSQRKMAPPQSDDAISQDVPQWKKELMEKKKAKNAPQSDEDPSLAGLPPWKVELMKKKKEKNSGVIDAGLDQSQC